MLKKEALIALLLLLVLWAGGAGEEAAAPPAGGQVRRIVSLSPSNTEILFALGAQEELAGVTTYCDYPAAALQKEKIGSFYSPDIEKIVLLRPDIVLANSTLQAEAIRRLRRAGLNVMPIKSANLDELLASIQEIARAIGRPAEGAALSARLSAYRQAAASRFAQQGARKRVFIEVWDRPLLTVGNRSYLSDVVREAGGDNVASALADDYAHWDMERIYAADPDVYLRLRGNDMGSRADVLPQGLRELRAVKSGRVVTVFGDWIVRPGPRGIEALPQIMEAIYGEGPGR